MTINNYCVTLIRFKKLHLVNMEHILVNTENKNQFIMRNSRDTGI